MDHNDSDPFPRTGPIARFLEGIHPRAGETLKRHGFDVKESAAAPDQNELRRLVADASIVGLRSKTRLPAEVVRLADRLLAVGAFCIGTDQIDLDACAYRGIAVFNAPYSNTRSVVEIVLAEIILLMRRAFETSSALHQGLWLKTASGCHEVRGKKLGIVGYGNIGSQLSVLAEGLGLEVYYHDVVEKLSLGKARKCRSLQDLLRRVDVVTLHVDGRAGNEGLIGAKQFAAMKDRVVFLNFSRGKVVDIRALARAVRSGKVAGAGIDVYPEEPGGKGQPFVSELRGLPNVILTPHIGGSTLEAQLSIGEFVAARLLDYVNTGSTIGSVNFPQISAPRLHRAHRLLHVHANVPGILAKINGILAGHRINILGQYLKTTEQIGYVITDVNKKYNRSVIEELTHIPHTIRFRILD
ncbi:MAG: phosphoglycerate dehydrogenase [Candidatus Riflebacteria bacterium]|nr:phosphoglycerate dehydrogenase [Candidatus Riflebacteria bacterium]